MIESPQAVIPRESLFLKQMVNAEGKWILQYMAPPNFVLQEANTIDGSWTNLQETRSYIGGDLRIYQPDLEAPMKYFRIAEGG